ncbi:unnamed protein product, partial [Gongylonema pulchrum]
MNRCFSESSVRRSTSKPTDLAKRTYPVREPEPFKERQSPPKFTFHLRPRLIQKNHPCKLICNVQGNPLPKVEWFKDGSPINMDRAHLTYRSGVCTLELFNSRIDDAGNYRCEATNDLGKDYTECIVTVQGRGGEAIPVVPHRTRRVYDSLKMGDIERSQSSADVSPKRSVTQLSTAKSRDDSTAKRAEKPPNFISKLSNNTVFEDEQAKFSCEVEGDPEPLIEWLHNGERVTEDARLRISSLAGRATLVISSVVKEDEGEYCCRASNSAGSETSRADLVVKNCCGKNQKLAVALESVHLFGAHFIKFQLTFVTTLQVEGDPEPLIEWLHNGERVTEDARLRISSLAGRATLVISSVVKEDEGEYCCRASNSAGSEASRADLVVKKRIVENGDVTADYLSSEVIAGDESTEQVQEQQQMIPN